MKIYLGLKNVSALLFMDLFCTVSQIKCLGVHGCERPALTFMLLLHGQVDLVDAGLNVVPGQIVAALLSGCRLKTHQFIHVPEEHTGRVPPSTARLSPCKKYTKPPPLRSVSLTPGVFAHLCAYSSSTLLSPVTALDSCFQRAARSPTSIASFISTTADSISTATSSSG